MKLYPPKLEVVRGDITHEMTDVIVNAANPSLMGGGGVDGAIHRAGGSLIREECIRLRINAFPEGLSTGAAVVTNAGDLKARWLIHTVGPVWLKQRNAVDVDKQLESCYRESLRIAEELGAESIAFPSVSTGIYGFPVERAAPIAIEALSSPTSIKHVRIVLFDEKTFDVFTETKEKLDTNSLEIQQQRLDVKRGKS